MKVLPELNAGAKWLLVGEAPGEEEAEQGKPFIGKSGKLLVGALAKVGLTRKQFNITNVCPYQPAGNDIKNIPKEVLADGKAALHEFIRETVPSAILAVGNTSLEALTGLRGISNRRGSTYDFEGIPVVATIHPAAALRDPQSVPLMLHDIAKFKQLVDGKLPPRMVRELITNPDNNDLEDLYEEALREGTVCADIEAFGYNLACVGFATIPQRAVCVPADTEERLDFIRRLIGDGRVAKVFHNSPYDVPFFEHRCGIRVAGQVEDTLAMAQALQPELPRDLATLTSLYTDQPYYKDMATDWKKAPTDPEVIEKLRQYNCLDVSTTIEIYRALEGKLLKNGLYDVYRRTRRVLPKTFQMSMRGLRYDAAEAKRLHDKMTKEVTRWQKVLDGRAGHPVNVYSNPQVSNLLYKELRLPVRRGKTVDSATTGEKVLNDIYAKTTDRRTKKILRAILEIRERRKFVSSYLKRGPSRDGRVRTSFNPMGTETGRWSASKFLIVEGTNLQTVPGIWKSCFIADEGMLFWNADYSQIEARIVAYMAQDARQMAVFEDPNGDIHKENAAVIFGKPVEEITYAERQIGKSVHALNYGVGPNTLMDHINKGARETGVRVSLAQAKRIREIYLERNPAVRQWQADTWEEVKRTKRLVNHFGRVRVFFGPTVAKGPLDYEAVEHTRKEGLAFIPQSDVPDMMNTALNTLAEQPPCPGFEVLLNVHDALAGQGPANDLEVWLPAIRKAMELPVPIHGRLVRIPVDIKVGTRWSELEKMK